MDITVSRIKQAMVDRGYEAPDVVRLSNGRIKQSTLWRILNGENSPSNKTLDVLGEILKVSPGYLMGFNVIPDEDKIITDFRKIPLLDWVQAGAFTLESNPDTIGQFDEWYLCPTRISKNGFCLRVRGESMEPKFYDGDIVFVDPDVPADPGKIVIVQDETFSGAVTSTMKKLVKDGNEVFLKALNPDWPGKKFIPFTERMRIVGVVIGKYVEI